MLELRAVRYEDNEVVFSEEENADAFGIFMVNEAELGWIADFADYGWAKKFAELYAEENELIFIDRVRDITSALP